MSTDSWALLIPGLFWGVAVVVLIVERRSFTEVLATGVIACLIAFAVNSIWPWAGTVAFSSVTLLVAVLVVVHFVRDQPSNKEDGDGQGPQGVQGA